MTLELLARRIARNMFGLMLGSMLVGSYVLSFFGISLPIVRVGGGLILAGPTPLIEKFSALYGFSPHLGQPSARPSPASSTVWPSRMW